MLKQEFKQYTIADPEMKHFISAMDYLKIPVHQHAMTLAALMKVLKRFELIDVWDKMTYRELMKVPSVGKAWIIIVVVAQQIKRGEISV